MKKAYYKPKNGEKKVPKKVEEKKTASKKTKDPHREPKFFTLDKLPGKIPSHKHHKKPTRLRRSITPGTVLILLSGRFRGKRVVFLKQLPSGLLLVTGPHAVNGVPLRRVNQAYVIATSTKVNLGELDVKKINDGFFKRLGEKKIKKSCVNFFGLKKKRVNPVTDDRKAEQKRVDGAILPNITSVPFMKHYLSARFSLTNKLLPHAIKF